MVQSKKVIALIVLTLGIESSLNGETRWTAIQGDGFNVISGAGGPTAAKMAHRVEQMRQLLGGSKKILPLRVVLVASEDLFAALRPSATVGGFFQSSADDDWIVVRWGHPDGERALSHELVHAFLEHSGPRRPLWLEEGLAEFYSTAQLDNKGWTIGRPIESHVRLLNQSIWLGEREFFDARPDSALREEGTRIGRFYAQSWAVVHYLLTTPGIREKAPALFTALADGVPFARASEATLGIRQGLLLEAARRSIETARFLTARLAAEPIANPASAPAPLSDDAASDLVISLALAAGRPELAAKTARTPTQRGLLALGKGDVPTAEKWFTEAVTAGTADPAPYFELAMILRENRRDAIRSAALLRAALERNPNHAEAHFLRGLDAAKAGNLEDAIDSYQQAAQILPRQATFSHALALALERAGRTKEASRAAIRCRLAARNPAEREIAAAINRLVEEPAMSKAEKKPDVQVPESWNGLRGDASAEGELTDFDCLATPPIATITTTTGPLQLRVEKPNAIEIRGTGAIRHTLTCGEQKLPVRVEYQKASNQLTAIEFR